MRRTHSREFSTRQRAARAHGCGVSTSRTAHSVPPRSTTTCGYSSSAAPPLAGNTWPFASTLQDTRSPTAVLVRAAANARPTRQANRPFPSGSFVPRGSDAAEQIVDALLPRIHRPSLEDRTHEVVHFQLEILREFPVLGEAQHRADHEREVGLGVLIVPIALFLVRVVRAVLVVVRIAADHFLVGGASEGSGRGPRLLLVVVIIFLRRHALLNGAHRSLGKQGR